jgi:hypothetical protein
MHLAKASARPISGLNAEHYRPLLAVQELVLRSMNIGCELTRGPEIFEQDFLAFVGAKEILHQESLS